MKEVWMCRWETVPGDGEHLENFPTLAAAKKAMRQKISQCVNLEEYLGDLDPAASQFLGRYLSDPEFPRSEEDVPEEYEEPERGELDLFASGITWKYPYDAYPVIETNLVLEESSDDQFRFNFWYQYPEEADGKGVTELTLRIDQVIEYGTSAYPLMVLRALQETPQTQEQIVRMILDMWDTVIDRKAVGRHLQLLQDLGFPVQKSKDGYYCGGEPCDPKAGVKYGTSAYPLMILQVLDRTPKTQAAIIQAVQGKYGTKIDRKAVSRHLKLLKELGFWVEQSQDGCYMK